MMTTKQEPVLEVRYGYIPAIPAEGDRPEIQALCFAFQTPDPAKDASRVIRHQLSMEVLMDPFDEFRTGEQYAYWIHYHLRKWDFKAINGRYITPRYVHEIGRLHPLLFRGLLAAMSGLTELRPIPSQIYKEFMADGL